MSDRIYEYTFWQTPDETKVPLLKYVVVTTTCAGGLLQVMNAYVAHAGEIDIDHIKIVRKL